MIQFNLLPDVKLEYIRAKRTKQLIMLISFIVSAVAITVLVLLFVVVDGVQKKHLSDLNKDVSTMTKKLKDTKDLDKVLTVQNQLVNLPALHDKKPVATRLFNYLGQITPSQISIAKIDVSFTDSSMTITGAADSIKTVNTFIDTMKFTTYTAGDPPVTAKAFSDVVLTNFGRDDKGASYTINLKFDPAIFNSKTEVKLIVPQQVTTRSETEKPTDLFQPNSNTKAQ